MDGSPESHVAISGITACRSNRMYETIETAKLIRALTRAIPGSYIRDHRGNGGWLDLMRGVRPIFDYSRWSDDRAWPAETLFNLRPGFMPRPALFNGVKMVSPGWQLQFRNLAPKLGSEQKRKIEKELGMRVF